MEVQVSSFLKCNFLILIFLILNNLKSEDKIKIGISTFLSGGAASSFGIPLKQGLDFMFKKINEGSVPAPYNSPGIGGRQFPIFLLMNTAVRQNRLQNSETWFKDKMLTLLWVIFHQVTV